MPRPVRRPIGKKVPSGAETPPVPVTTVVENKEKEGDGDRDDLGTFHFTLCLADTY